MLLITDFCLCSIFGDGYPCFEISGVNADKPPLTVSQIKDHVEQFQEVDDSILSQIIRTSNLLWICDSLMSEKGLWF